MDPHTAALLSLAIRYAAEHHDGQYRKGSGDPYIVHPLRVMAALEDQPVHVRVAAVLHDTVEDTTAELSDIRREFGEKVVYLVDALSRRPDETYMEFIVRVVLAGREAMLIKRADIQDNLRDATDAMASLRRRYEAALLVLDAELGAPPGARV